VIVGCAAVVMAIVGTAAPAKAGDVRHSTIPKSAWGTWALKPELCGTNDNSNLYIKEGGASGPSNDCSVEYVVETAGAGGPIYSTHLWCTAKDDPAMKRSMTFIVILRGDRLTVGDDFDHLTTYDRCPSAN
jgi:hypothetical protein